MAELEASDVAALVASLAYKPGWTFKLGGPLRGFLCVFARTPDSQNPGSDRTTQHMFPLPAMTDARAFLRWVFEQLMLAELHECGEFFAAAGHKPFFPHHQDEGSPYERVERWETTPWA